MALLRRSRYLKFFDFFKNLIRNNSTNFSSSLKQENEEKTENNTHIYKKSMTHDEVIEFLLDNVVYQKDDIVVTSKPYGVGKKKPVKTILNFIPQTFNDLYLENMLPEVAERLGFKSLKVVKAPERYASGVMIFTGSEKATLKIKKSILEAQNIYQNTYITVSIGQLLEQKLETKFALKQNKNNSDFSTVHNEWSNKSTKSNETILVRWKHNVLASSELASLVKVSLSNIHWNSLRLFMATKCLSPILGDILFGWRVKNVGGVPLLVDPLACTPKVPKKLDPKLLSALQITQNEAKIIPCHVHLQSVMLPFKKGMDFFVSVPPPESFVWTCQQLNLAMAEHSLL